MKLVVILGVGCKPGCIRRRETRQRRRGDDDDDDDDEDDDNDDDDDVSAGNCDESRRSSRVQLGTCTMLL